MSDQPAPPDAETPQRLDGLVAFAGGLESLVSKARLQVVILSHALPRDVYGAQAVVDRVQGFLLSSERAHIRVLVHSPELAMRRAHRFVADTEFALFSREGLILLTNDGAFALEMQQLGPLVIEALRRRGVPAAEAHQPLCTLRTAMPPLTGFARRVLHHAAIAALLQLEATERRSRGQAGSEANRRGNLHGAYRLKLGREGVAARDAQRDCVAG